MAEGNPILAVWGPEGTLRTFELSGGGFVQVHSSGGLGHHVDPGYLPALRFAHDGKFVLLQGGHNSVDAVRWRTFLTDNLSAGQVASIDRPTGPNAALGFSGYSDFDGFGAFGSIATDGGARGNNALVVREDGTFSNAASVAHLSYQQFFRAMSVSPDGNFVVRAQAAGNNSEVFVRLGYTTGGNVYPMFGNPSTGNQNEVAFILMSGADIDIIRWSPDSQYMFTVAKNGPIQVYRRDGNTLELTYTFTDPLGNPVALATSPDGRTVAIGFNNGGVYTTGIFRRVGPYLQRVQTTGNGFGRLLDFSGDGGLLVDAVSRITYELDLSGTFVELVGALTNVPAGMTVQAVSPHTANPKGWARLYDGSIPQIALGLADLANLKVALLDANAEFLPSHSTLDQVTNNGLWEVAVSGWPVGGRVIPNVNFVDLGGGMVGLICGPVAQVAIEGGIEFRSAVVYDASHATKKPLAFLDFQSARAVPTGAELKFTFRDTGLLAFGA